jgi:hypothetical protein
MCVTSTVSALDKPYSSGTERGVCEIGDAVLLEGVECVEAWDGGGVEGVTGRTGACAAGACAEGAEPGTNACG